MSEYLIPDLFRLVLEYSNLSDRKVWNFPEDTGVIHEMIYLNKQNTKFLSRVIGITINIHHDLSITPVKLPYLKTYILNPLSWPHIQRLASVGDDQYLINELFVTPVISYAPNLTTLDMSLISYIEELDLSHNPKLTCLKLTYDSEYILDLSVVPQLTSLTLFYESKTALDLSGLVNLTHLTIQYMLDMILNLTWFPKLTELILVNINCKLDLFAVPHLTVLKMGNKLNTLLDLSAVPKLVTLQLSPDYTYELDLTQCIHLKELNLSAIYTYPLDLSNCTNLQELDLGYCFNSSLCLDTNINLKVLRMGIRFNHPLSLRYNTNLKDLQIGEYYSYPLCLSTNINLKSLEMGAQFNHPLDLTNTKVTELYISPGCAFDSPIYVSNPDFECNLEELVEYV